MSNSDVIIQYNEILEAIEIQFQAVLEILRSSDKEDVRTEASRIKNIVVSDEQQFIKKHQAKLQLGNIYIVVKFGAGSINYASSVCPVSLMCMGTANEVKPAQLLLSVFSSSWTTKNMYGKLGMMPDVLQVWNTPEVLSNFAETNIEFRSLLVVRGNIIVGPAAVRVGTLTYYYDEETNRTDPTKGFEVINIMSFQDDFQSSLDTQPFGNTNGFTVSEVNFSSYVFTISTYMLNTYLGAAMLAIRGFRNRTNPNGIGYVGSSGYFNFKPNQKMKIKIQFTNGYNNIPDANESSSEDDTVLGDTMFGYFKVVNSHIGQEIAGLPSLTIAFTR